MTIRVLTFHLIVDEKQIIKCFQKNTCTVKNISKCPQRTISQRAMVEASKYSLEEREP